MARHDDVRIVPERERKLKMLFDAAMKDGYGLTSPTKNEPFRQQEPTFRHSYAIHRYFEQMSREGDDGYVTGAWVFARGMDDRQASRAVRSHALTQLALGVYMASNPSRREPRESEVSHIGRFVNELIETFPEMHVQWMEDMHAGIAEHRLERQPTSVIRGVLLSSNLDQRRAVRFWELSLASERFPDRVFSDPCGPDDGTVFSSYQVRAFALVFAFAPEEAVRKYAAHMRDHARIRLVREWDEEERCSHIREREADVHARTRILHGVVGHIADAGRRQVVAEIFDVRPSAA